MLATANTAGLGEGDRRFEEANSSDTAIRRRQFY